MPSSPAGILPARSISPWDDLPFSRSCGILAFRKGVSAIMVAFWLTVTVLGLVTEGFTQKFIAIMVSIGALVALLTEMLGLSPGMQFFIFVTTAGILMASTRTMAKEYLAAKAQHSADASEMPGVTCQVVETIDNVAETGVIEYNGRNWEARAECTTRYEPGVQVRITRMARGVAYVEEVPPEEEEPEVEIDPETGEPIVAEETVPEPDSEEGAVFELSGES